MNFFHFIAAFVRWIVCVLVLTGCGAAAGDEPTAPTSGSDISPGTIVNKPVKIKSVLKCKSGTDLNYQNFGRGFLMTYCLTCHAAALDEASRMGAPVNINFDSVNDVQLWRANILKVVKPALKDLSNKPLDPDDKVSESKPGTKMMPPDGNVDPSAGSQLLEWLSCGAPAGNPEG